MTGKQSLEAKAGYEPLSSGSVRIRARGGARLLLVLLAAGALLAGCGGGGGGGGGAPAPTALTSDSTSDQQPAPRQPQPPPVARTPAPPPVMAERCAGVETENFGCLSAAAYRERRDAIAASHRAASVFSNQWGLARVNADKAWADAELLRGTAAPGTGVTIGFIDTGIDPDHPLFEGSSITETILPGAADEDGRTRFSHGTAVASIAAAAPDAICDFSRTDGACVDFRGVAPGAAIKMFAITLGSPRPNLIYRATSLVTLLSNDAADAATYNRVLGENLDVLNLSFGRGGLIDLYTEEQLRANYGRVIAALAQADAERKTILVWSAGNSNGELCLPGSSSHCVGSGRTGIDPRDPANCLNNDPPNCVSKPAGELNARSPNVFPGLVARIPELRGHSVAVVAVGENGAVASFSNRCGEAADWCVAAPGAGIQVAYFGPLCLRDSGLFTGVCGEGGGTLTLTLESQRNIVSGGGTSYAAPMVAGGLAVMRQVFRDQLSSEELLARLFRTANKTGRYADREVYGQGLMDLGAATNPVGELQVVAGGGSVGDAGHPLAATRLSMGGPLGDGLATALGGVEIAALDALGAPFWFDSSALALPSGGGISNERRLHDLIAPRRKRRRAAAGYQDAGWRFGFYKSPVASESSLFDLAENAATFSYRTPGGLEATAFAASGLAGEENESPDAGLALAYRPPASGLGARLGWLREEDSALGSKADGAFGRLSADSLVAGVEAETELAGWTLAAEAEAGFSRIHAGGGMIAGFSDVTTSALALSARRRLSPRDAFTFSVSQPPRVESGRARLALPVGRTRSGTILRRPVLADVAPSGRQIDVSARWRRANVWKGELSLEAIWSRHPGHVGKKPELGLLAGWRVRW